MIRITDARIRSGFVVWLRFNDGAEGEVDLASELHGQVFEPLRDPIFFSRMQVDPELHTITWPNGADFAPEFLYDRVQVAARRVVQRTVTAATLDTGNA